MRATCVHEPQDCRVCDFKMRVYVNRGCSLSLVMSSMLRHHVSTASHHGQTKHRLQSGRYCVFWSQFPRKRRNIQSVAMCHHTMSGKKSSTSSVVTFNICLLELKEERLYI